VLLRTPFPKGLGLAIERRLVSGSVCGVFDKLGAVSVALDSPLEAALSLRPVLESDLRLCCSGLDWRWSRFFSLAATPCPESNIHFICGCGNLICGSLICGNVVLWRSPQPSLVHSVLASSIHAGRDAREMRCSPLQNGEETQAEAHLAHAGLMGR